MEAQQEPGTWLFDSPSSVYLSHWLNIVGKIKLTNLRARVIWPLNLFSSFFTRLYGIESRSLCTFYPLIITTVRTNLEFFICVCVGGRGSGKTSRRGTVAWDNSLENSRSTAVTMSLNDTMMNITMVPNRQLANLVGLRVTEEFWPAESLAL